MGSKSSSANQSTTTTNTQNLNLQGISGHALAGVDNSTVNFISSDQGAIDSALDFASGAFEGVYNVLTGSFEVMNDTQQQALNNMRDTAGDAIELSSDSIDRIASNSEFFAEQLAKQNTQSLGVVSDTVGEAMTSAEYATTNALSFANNAMKGDAGQTQDMIKYALIAVTLIVAVTVVGGKK